MGGEWIPSAPRRVDGRPTWSFARDDWRIRFVGRADRPEAARSIDSPRGRSLALLRQVHGSKVVRARAGDCGAADALVVADRGVAAAIATADCVPVVVVGDHRGVAIHAGWRGLVAGVIPTAIAALAQADRLAAWIGPAIGACCYEVGVDVAAAVASASSPAVRHQRPGERLHLDLQAAAEAQLRGCGVVAVERIDCCTRCHPEQLWSHRRDGALAGRNWALLWLAGAGEAGALALPTGDLAD